MTNKRPIQPQHSTPDILSIPHIPSGTTTGSNKLKR